MSTPEFYRAIVAMLFEEASASYVHKKEDSTRVVPLSCSSVSQCDFSVFTGKYKIKQVPQKGLSIKLSPEEVAAAVSKKWATHVVEAFRQKINHLVDDKRIIEAHRKPNPDMLYRGYPTFLGDNAIELKEGDNLFGWIPEGDAIANFISKMQTDLESDAKIIALAGQAGKVELAYDFSDFPAADQPDMSHAKPKEEEEEDPCHTEVESAMSQVVSKTAQNDDANAEFIRMVARQTDNADIREDMENFADSICSKTKPPKSMEELLQAGMDL